MVDLSTENSNWKITVSIKTAFLFGFCELCLDASVWVDCVAGRMGKREKKEPELTNGAHIENQFTRNWE